MQKRPFLQDLTHLSNSIPSAFNEKVVRYGYCAVVFQFKY